MISYRAELAIRLYDLRQQKEAAFRSFQAADTLGCPTTTSKEGSFNLLRTRCAIVSLRLTFVSLVCHLLKGTLHA